MLIKRLSITPREAIAAIIICVLLALLTYDYAQRYEAERRVTYYPPDDQPVIDRTLDLWAVENNQPRNQILNSYFPIVVNFRQEKCVVLALKYRAGAGGDPIYCFAPKSLRLTRIDLSHAD